MITEKFAYSINYTAAIKGESSSKDNLLAVAILTRLVQILLVFITRDASGSK